MKFKYFSEYYPDPSEPNDYISEGIVDVVEWTEAGEEHLIGRLALDCINVPRVVYGGREHLYTVCDADSQGWHNVFAALFDYKTCELIPEIGCEEPFDFLFLLYRMELHPVIQQLEAHVLHHVAQLNGESTILNMLEGISKLPAKRLASIGFRKVAGSKLLFLPAMLTSDPPVPSDADLHLELDSSIDYTQELLSLWNSEKPD